VSLGAAARLGVSESTSPTAAGASIAVDPRHEAHSGGIALRVKNRYGDGSIRQRSSGAFQVRWYAGGKRYEITVRGTLADAKRELRARLKGVDDGQHVAPSRITLADYVRSRLSQWRKSGEISATTYERYWQIIENQVVPFIGAKLVQKLTPLDIEQWHSALRAKGRKDGAGGISARTVISAHRVLGKALNDAMRFDLVTRNVTGPTGQSAPRVAWDEVEIVPGDKIGDMLTKLKDHAIYHRVVVALFTGLRRSELLALRWVNVDLDRKVIAVRESLLETSEGITIKDTTKTKAGRRDVTMPGVVVSTLRDVRRRQLEERLALGLGKLPDDALVFPGRDGNPSRPTNLSSGWATVARAIGLPGVTWHALRHTHASMLIDAGIDVVRVSKRLGHADPSVTLRIYSHLFAKRDDKSADAIDAAVAALKN
jgi:integrase